MEQEHIDHMERTLERLREMHWEVSLMEYGMACYFNPEAHLGLESLASQIMFQHNRLQKKLEEVQDRAQDLT